MKYLIVNADDFGMTRGINGGIVTALREGIVTSAGMLACGDAFADACELASARGIREVGVHLCLTELPPVVLRTRMKNYGSFLLKFLSGAVTKGEVRDEFRAQIEKVRKAGFEIVHVSSHEHIHMIPDVFTIFVEMAREYNIPSLRYLREEGAWGRLTPGRLYRMSISRYFARKNETALENSNLYHADHLLGFLDSGMLTEKRLIEMLNSLREGVTELVCHPGFLSPEIVDKFRWHINCEDELFALTSPAVRRAIEANHIKLVTFEEARALTPQRESHL